MKRMHAAATAFALMAAMTANASPAAAGGVFGDGGLIRGTIGNVLDRHLEKPILTPLAKFTTVAAFGAAGAYGGAFLGAPELGALLGAGAGDAVNDLAAGKH